MLRNWALLPLIGYSPSQLLTLAVCRLRVCAMSVRTFCKSSRFLYRSLPSTFSIRSRFDSYSHVHSHFSSQNSSFNVCGVLSVAAECNFVGPLFAPLGRAVEESLIPTMSVLRKIAIARIPARIKTGRRTRHLDKRSSWRNWNLNLGGVGPFLPC